MAPDINSITDKSPLKEGFRVELIETGISTVSKADGSFEITYIPENTDGYTIIISKPGYLSRNIKSVMVDIGSANSPVTLWAEDINQDNSINMVDVMEIAKAFNITSTNENFNSVCDLNKDNAINLMTLCFGKAFQPND